MAYPIPKDRVKDTTTTTGTGNITLSGTAPTGYQSFNTAFGTSVYFNYCITGGSEWETGIGHLSASTTLVRDTILSSSNSGSAVSFSSGTKDVFVTLPGEFIEQIAYVASDVTYNNNNTLASLTDLTMNVVAGGVYRVEMCLVGTRVSATGMKLDFNGGSATVTAFRGLLVAATASTNTASISTQLNPAVATDWCHFFTGMLIVNAAGTFIPRTSQFTATADDTIVRTGSHLKLKRIA